MKEFWVDTETGGTNPQTDALLQIAGMIIIDGVEQTDFNIQIRPLPDQNTNAKALEVNGLTYEDLTSPDRVTVAQAHQQLMQVMRGFVNPFDPKDKFQFFAYNARFDMDFIRELFNLAGDQYVGSWFYFPPIDVMQWAALMWINERGSMKRFTLKECCEKAGIPWDDEAAHEAMYDIRQTRKLAMVFDDLHSLQVF